MKRIKFNKKRICGIFKGKRGFTLVELVIAVAIFSLVIATAVGLLTSALRVQRRSISLQNIQDNGRYLLELMAKEARMSEIINSDGESQVLNLIHPVNGNIVYTFTGAPNWQITREDDDGVGIMNSDEVEIEGEFFVDGETLDDDEQPTVTIIMEARTTGTKSEEQAEIKLQTTLSQRKLSD